MTTTIEAMKQARAVLQSGDLLCEVTAASILREAFAAEEAQTITPSKRPIAGINVKADDGYGPNFHLYRLLGANDLAPGEYELFIRPTQEPAIDRPTNCGTGHCSCVECVCEPVAPDSERTALIAKLRDMPPNPFRLMMWEAADMLAADARRATQQDQPPLAWRVSLDKGATWIIYETDPAKIHGMDAAIITPLVARHTQPTDWSAA